MFSVCSITKFTEKLGFYLFPQEKKLCMHATCMHEHVRLLYLADTEALLNRFVVCPDAGKDVRSSLQQPKRKPRTGQIYGSGQGPIALAINGQGETDELVQGTWTL